MVISQERETVDLSFTQGDAVGFSFRFIGMAANASDAWSAEIRRAKSRVSELIAAFTVSSSVDGADCLVSVGLAAGTALEAGVWWYDLQSDNGAGGVRTWLGGRVAIEADVTE